MRFLVIRKSPFCYGAVIIAFLLGILFLIITLSIATRIAKEEYRYDTAINYYNTIVAGDSIASINSVFGEGTLISAQEVPLISRQDKRGKLQVIPAVTGDHIHTWDLGRYSLFIGVSEEGLVQSKFLQDNSSW